MDDSPWRLLIPIVILLVLSGYFSAAEMALSSVNRIRMMSRAENGDRRAARIVALLEDFDKTLISLLIGNNIVNIGAAALATLMATRLWGLDSVAYATIVMTVVIFLFSENLPKAYAKACSERLALALSGSILLLTKLFGPLAFLFGGMSRLLSKPFKKKDEPTVTEDELHVIIETIAQEGALDEEKTELVQSALEFSERTARDILMPWGDVLTVSLDMSSEEILSRIRSCAHSRLPVTGAGGEVLGVLHIRKYLKAYLSGNAVLSDVMDDAHYIRSDIPIDDLLPVMSAGKTHMSVVLSAEGETAGGTCA